MFHDGLPVRAVTGAREAAADRRTGLLASTGLILTLIVAACGNTASTGTPGASGAPPATTGASPSTEASAGASNGLNQGFLTFQELNASKVFGGGTITDLGDGSSAVTLGVVAVGYADPLPARLVSGSCADAASAPLPSYAPPPSAEPSAAGSAAAPSVAPSVAASPPAESGAPTPATLPVELTPISGGGSNTIVEVPLADVLATPSSVLVYKSAAEPTLVACSDVTPTLVLPSIVPGASPSSAPAASLPAASASTAP